MLHDRFRTHTMAVERPIRTSDGSGGWTRTLVAAEAVWGGDPDVEWGGEVVAWGGPPEVTGSLQPAGAAESTAADREEAEARWIFYCDPGSDITRDDELTNTGRRFRVIAIAEWDADSTIDHMRVDLEQIQVGA